MPNIYVSILLSATICMAMSLFTNRRSENMVYYLSLIILFFWAAIKYYLAGDIATYVPYYESLPNISEITTINYSMNDYYELFFFFFCVVMKSLGVSYYALTLIIVTLLFHSLHCTSKLFDRYRIIGICLLIMIGTDLVLIQIRQALAMTFFLYAFVAAVKNKSNLKILALLIICSLSHKSGVVVSTLFFLFVIISKEPIKISRTVFAIETLVFGIFLFVSFDGLINYFINVGIFPKQIVNSFNEHFFYKNIAPREIFLHVPVLLILSLVPDNRTDKLSLCSRVVSFIYVLFVALFYKYQIFLNRFLLYLLPVTCLYTINLLYYNYNNTLKSSRLYSQTFMVCVIFLGMFITIQYARSIKDPLNMVRMDTKTIFDVMFKKEEERESIRQEQLEKSRIYWEYYYKLGKKKLLDKNKMR